MFQRTKICSGLLLAFGAAISSGANAQDATDTSGATQRVEITGSAIKRIAVEGALPVQTLTQDDIKKSGVTSVTDLIQGLPVMQGFETTSQSINGGGAGASNASIHGIGSSYTLVLLNGHRVASYGKGSEVDLGTIPLSAIDHVDVLLDGASALYGADAIAGVVNIVLKHDTTEGTFNASVDAPTKVGGKSASASISKGFGDLAKDRYNIFLAASFDHQQALEASQRSFSKSGILKFKDGYGSQEVDLVSSYTPQANVYAPTLNSGSSDGTGTTISYNPSTCSTANTLASGKRCLYDYSATVEDIPASRRSSFLANGRFQLNDKASLFANVLSSQSRVDARYAAPAQSFVLTDSQLATYVTPELTNGDTADASNDIAKVRLIGVGGRKDGYLTNTLHTVIGADLTTGNWDSTFSFTHSQNHWYDIAEGGYASTNAVDALMESGAYDPFSADPQTSVLASTVLHQTLEQTRSTLDVASAHTSTTLMTLPGGDLSFGTGLDVTRQKFTDRPAAIELVGATDSVFGGSSGALPFDSSRNSWGGFVELDAPLTKKWDVDGSARFDSYGAVKNKDGYDSFSNPLGEVTQGKKSSSVTFKLSSSFRPTKELLLRGSYGTGFKMPTIGDISNPLTAYGVTGMHTCSANVPSDLANYCVADSNEYNEVSVGQSGTGSDALKPERSQQWTLGFRIEPSPAFSFGTDLWTVRLHDQISSISEDTAFNDMAAYSSLFLVRPDPATGVETLTFISKPINTGNAFYQGLDLDAESHIATPVGRLTTRGHLTWMLRADYQTPGTSGYLNSLSKVGVDGTVMFRYQLNASTSLEQGAFTHTLGFNFKPGYKDDTTDYCYNSSTGYDSDLACSADSPNRRVSSYVTFDFQEKYDVSKVLSVTGGIKNLFDRNPPFSLNDQSGTGNARGYDGRYTNPLGRTLQASVTYKF